MKPRTLPAILAVLLFTPFFASGGLYEFTFQGEVTYSILPEANVGDSVTIRYIADSTDLEPLPMTGEYAATNATIRFPGGTFVTEAGLGTRLSVNLFGTLDTVAYLSHGNPYGIKLSFAFAGGTPQSDELPLTLPLLDANVATFHMFPASTDVIRGRITSYLGVEVPEPAALGVLLASIVLTKRSAAR